MHVVSLNVNGIRAAVRRGLLGWVAEKRPELICVYLDDQAILESVIRLGNLDVVIAILLAR